MPIPRPMPFACSCPPFARTPSFLSNLVEVVPMGIAGPLDVGGMGDDPRVPAARCPRIADFDVVDPGDGLIAVGYHHVSTPARPMPREGDRRLAAIRFLGQLLGERFPG